MPAMTDTGALRRPRRTARIEPGDRIVHPTFGAGRVTAIIFECNLVTAVVHFDADSKRCREVSVNHLIKE
jgi:hypothetical protein